MSNFPSVESLRQRVEELRRSSPRSNTLVDSIWDLADTYWFRPDEAVPLALEGLEIAEANEYRFGEARCHLILAKARYIQVRYDDVAPHVVRALPVFIERKARYEYAGCMLLLAAISQVAGAYDQSLEHCFKGLQAASEVDAAEAQAWLYYRTADAYRELGDRHRTLEFARLCQESFDSLYPKSHRQQHQVGTARARTQLAAAHLALEQYDEAFRFSQDALEIYREVGDELGETRALSDIGQIHRLNGDLDQAEVSLRKSMQIRERLGHRASLASNLLTLGEIYLARGDIDTALTTFHEVLSIAIESGVKLRAYQAHEALARVFQASGYSDKALVHYQKYHALKEETAGEAMNLRVHNMKAIADIEAAEREAEIERQKSIELQAKNEALAELLDQLRITQDRLVQSEKMASLGQLTAGIAHEIRNPLNFVKNFAELTVQLSDEIRQLLSEIREDISPEHSDEFVDLTETLQFNSTKIREHGQRADAIVSAMLEHSRGGEGQRTETDLNLLLNDCVDRLNERHKKNQPLAEMEIRKDYDPTLPKVAVLARDVGRVFENILNNSFHALQELDSGSQGIICLTTRSTESAVFIEISDNGPGIPDEVRTRVFEPFFTTKPTGSGTGLGLSLAYDIITQGHAGRLECAENTECGAKFTIVLPVTAES